MSTQCPQCNCRIEKNGGCPHMDCANCNYSWCWICGTEYNATGFKQWPHYLNIPFTGNPKQGLLCNMTNNVTFGFEGKIKFHWIIRLVFTIVIICLTPVFYVLFLWAGTQIYIWNKYINKCLPSFKQEPCGFRKVVIGFVNAMVFMGLVMVSFAVGVIIESILIWF